jgi:hypothetical protein
LLDPRVEEWIAGDEDGVGVALSKLRESAVDLVLGSRRIRMNLQVERLCGVLHLVHFGFRT